MAHRRGAEGGDVTIAKNYLREDEIEELNRIVVMFLDFAEDQARRKKQIFLQSWVTRLHDFLNLNERAILPDAGKVSREEARQTGRGGIRKLRHPPTSGTGSAG